MKTLWKVGETVVNKKDNSVGRIEGLNPTLGWKVYMGSQVGYYSPEELESYLRKPTEEERERELKRQRLFLEKTEKLKREAEVARKKKEEQQKRVQEEKSLSPKERQRRRRVVNKEQLLASKTFQQVIDLLFVTHGVRPSPYSYHSGIKEKAERIAQDYGTSLEELSRYGMSHQNPDDIREGCGGKAYAPKGTAATFDMEELADSEKDLLNNFKSEFPFAVCQKQDSSWGGQKTTFNQDSFWFPYVLRLIELGLLPKL